MTDWTMWVGLWTIALVAFAFGFIVASRFAVTAYAENERKWRERFRERDLEYGALYANAQTDPTYDAFSTSEEGVNKNAGEFSHLADDVALAASAKILHKQ